MSALNMAMNGNAYKMIEIKKVNGPVVPMHPTQHTTVPMSNLSNLSEPLRPFDPLQKPQIQQPRLYQQQHTDINHSTSVSHTTASISHSSYSPLSTSNGTVQRPVPPPPPSREGTLSSRVDGAPPRGERVGVLEGQRAGAGQEGTPPPPRPSEETNGVSTVSPQELDFNTKEDEKWWWVCCLEFCFCLL